MNAIPLATTSGFPEQRWRRIPDKLRERPQWALAVPGPDKRPRTAEGGYASCTAPSTWTDFDTACSAALARGWQIGFMLCGSDPFTCIDLDIKNAETHPYNPDVWTTPEQIERHAQIVAQANSYTEWSRSGRGRHIFVCGNVGTGRRRDDVELYSQSRFIICTGDVEIDLPIADRRQFVTNMASLMQPKVSIDSDLRLDAVGDDMGCCIATIAMESQGEIGLLMRGDWQGRNYPSQSEADFALMTSLARASDSNGACREAFRLSMLSKREDKPNNYTDTRLNAMLRKVRARLEDEIRQVEDGAKIAEGLGWSILPPMEPSIGGDLLLDQLNVDWSGELNAEVPDVVEGLVADEDVTLLGGHGGVGKSFLALQIACAGAAGASFLGKATQRRRVLYYSAEDGRKRLTRRLRNLVEFAGLDGDILKQNLRLLDASEVEPLYGETVEHGEGRRAAFVKLLGPRADFHNLQQMVESFDPHVVVIDGASDTFDGNEIARREVRAFIKMLRQVHRARPIAVLLLVHIDRSSARGHSSNDDGYAGSAQWHNSCRRRMFLQHVIKKERDDDGSDSIVSEEFVLRLMKNQDGPPDPDTVLQRDQHGFWRVGGVDLSGIVGPELGIDPEARLLRLIAEYYKRGQFISTSLAPQATSGVYATLKDDPEFPKGLTRKRTQALVRKLDRIGYLVAEDYKRTNRSTGDRWAVACDAANFA